MTETAHLASPNRRQMSGFLLLFAPVAIVFVGWIVSDRIGGPNAFIAFLIVAAVMFIAGFVLTRAWRRPEVPVRVDPATGTAYRDVRVEFGEEE